MPTLPLTMYPPSVLPMQRLATTMLESTASDRATTLS
jgi:hypothetical protein